MLIPMSWLDLGTRRRPDLVPGRCALTENVSDAE